MGKKNPYSADKTFAKSEQEQAARDKTLAATEGRLNTAQSTINPMKNALLRFYDPNYINSYAKTQTDLRTSDTNKAFNNSLAAQRARARMSGFGYEQPAEQVGETNVENARSAELARIPAEMQKEAADMEFKAIGLGSGLAGQENALANTELGMARTYNPEGYYRTGVEQNEAEQARKGGFWKSLASLGLGLATAPMTGGGSLFGNLFKKK